MLLEVTAQRDDIAALVADGAAAGSFQDWHHLRGVEVGTAPGWLMFATIGVLSGDRPGPPLEDLVRRIRTPTLLISAGEAEERQFNVLYDTAARGPVEHWNLPRRAPYPRPPRAPGRVRAARHRALRPGAAVSHSSSAIRAAATAAPSVSTGR